MNVKTQIEVLTLIGEILKQMSESQAIGISRACYYIENVDLCSLLKVFDGLKTNKNDVRLYFVGEYYNEDTIDICYRVVPGYIIYITSVPQNILKPKINLVNYN